MERPRWPPQPAASMELEVRGRALRTIPARPQGVAFAQITSLKMFRVNSPDQVGDPEHEEDFEAIDKKHITKAKLKEKKGFQRRGGKCERKEEGEREPVKVWSQTFPTYTILIELCRHQHRRLEDIKNDILAQSGGDNTNLSEHDLSYSDLDKYLAAAHYQLYQQHINNAKDAIFKLHSSTSSKKTDQNLDILYEESKRVSSAPN